MKFKIGKSKIEGKGLIVKEPIREGELIGLAHIDNKPTKVVGMFHNHSEEPTAASVEMGNKRYLFALRELNAGDEITTDYRKQPELEQPEDFQKGGQMTPQKDGYRTYSPYKDLPYIDIDSNVIDTDNLAHDGLVLIGDNGTVREVANNSGNVTIPGANVVREIPYNLKRGGLVKMPKPSKKGLASKAYTKSLDGTNKLFTESYLFEKPKSRKNKVFDPSAKYYQDGGGVNITKLTPEEEAQFQKFYFTLPDNLMDDDPSYDIRGYWNSEGKPESFNYDQPKEKDGYYHAYSINGNTGEYLKAPTHPTFQHAVHEDRKIGYRPVTNVYGRNIATENPALIEPEEQSFLNNTSGPRAYQQGGVPMAEYGMPMGTGISQNYMGRTKSFYQNGGIPTVPTAEQAAIAQPIPEMIPLAEIVTPQVEPIVNQPAKEIVTPVPTKKEVEKVAMPKIEKSGNITAIQKKLVSAGYDIGKSGPKKDGVDGIMGNRTKMALDAFNAGIPPSKTKVPQGKTTTGQSSVVNKNMGTGYLPYLDKGEETCVKGKGCSYNASKKMKDLLGNVVDENIWANDAWFNKSDVLNKGGDLLYETKEKEYSKMGKVPKEVYSKLQVGDYVQLDRVNTKTSYEFESETKPGLKNEKIEHLGFVIGKDKDGTPLIWHASESGNAYIKRIDEDITLDDHDKDIFNYKVSSIVRDPKLKNANLKGLQNTPYYTAIDANKKLVPKQNTTETQKEAVNTINNSIKNFKNLGYAQEDVNFIGQILVGGIMQNETKGGESYKRIPKEIAATVWKDVLGQESFKGDEPSIGYYQMKPTLNFVNKDGSLNKLGQQLEKLGVDPKDIGTFDVDAQTKAGTVILLNNYEQLKKDKDFNAKTGLYKGKIPASYILAKSWQAGVDWQNREKYAKFLNNLDIDYSDNALKNATSSIAVTGSSKSVNNDYAKLKAAQSKIDAQKAEAQRKAYEAKAALQRKQQSEYNKGKAQTRKPGYAESTAIRNLPEGPLSVYKKQIDTLVKNSKKAPAKKPAYKSSFGKLNEQIAKVNPYSDLYKPRFKSGGYVETELTPEEIKAYRAQGYIVEEM